MKVPLIVGGAVLLVVAAAALLAPQFRSGATKAAEQARTDAELARRLLHRYDFQLADLQRLAPPQELEKHDLARIAEAVRDDLQSLQKELASKLTTLRTRARDAGLPEPQLEAPKASRDDLRQSIQRFGERLQQNQALLRQAQQQADEARRATDANVLGVAQINGLAKLAQAERLLADARDLRNQQRAAQERLMDLAAATRELTAGQEFLANLDVAGTQESLAGDAAQLKGQSTAAAQEAQALSQAVSEREQALAAAEARLAELREQLTALENQGFQAGNDSSFEDYRTRYSTLAQDLREIQEQEQLLRSGGLEGSAPSDDGAQEATLAGTPVVSLDILRQRSVAATERATRLASAVQMLEMQAAGLSNTAASADESKALYAARLEQQRQQAAELVQRIAELAAAAVNAEDEALSSARDAQTAFKAAQKAADEWRSRASSVQSERDPERRNPRLSQVLADRGIGVMGSSAEAETLTLIGRIQAQRAEAADAVSADLKLLGDLVETDLTPEQFDQQAVEARQAGSEKLQAALKLYDGLSNKADKTVKWIPQTGRAAVLVALARVEPTEAQLHLGEALSQLREATSGAERSPYVRDQVEFRNFLEARVAPAATAPAEQEPAETQPGD